MLPCLLSIASIWNKNANWKWIRECAHWSSDMHVPWIDLYLWASSEKSQTCFGKLCHYWTFFDLFLRILKDSFKPRGKAGLVLGTLSNVRSALFQMSKWVFVRESGPRFGSRVRGEISCTVSASVGPSGLVSSPCQKAAMFPQWTRFRLEAVRWLDQKSHQIILILKSHEFFSASTNNKWSTRRTKNMKLTSSGGWSVCSIF